MKIVFCPCDNQIFGAALVIVNKLCAKLIEFDEKYMKYLIPILEYMYETSKCGTLPT